MVPRKTVVVGDLDRILSVIINDNASSSSEVNVSDIVKRLPPPYSRLGQRALTSRVKLVLDRRKNLLLPNAPKFPEDNSFSHNSFPSEPTRTELPSLNEDLYSLYAKTSPSEAPPQEEEKPIVASPPAQSRGQKTSREAGGLDAERAAKRLRRKAALQAALNELPLGDPDNDESTAKRKFEPVPMDDLKLRLSDLGGIDGLIRDIQKFILGPLKHPEVYSFLGEPLGTGVLLHGVPGSGKTSLALAIAGEAQVPFFRVNGPEFISGVSGESEATLRSLFDTAKAVAPALLFIDDLDILCPKKDSVSREMERRIVSQLGLCMDDALQSAVIVLGATSRADSLDLSVRRNRRFDHELCMGLPDPLAREKILHAVCRSTKVADDLNFKQLALKTSGYVGADILALRRMAVHIAATRVRQTPPDDPPPTAMTDDPMRSYSPEMLEAIANVRQEDFDEALAFVQPSAKREGFATIPGVSWEEVGALGEQKKFLRDRVCNPMKFYSFYEELGLAIPAGVLLWGPPGCGKTLLAKAIATESGANFISVKGPELLNKFVGESERAIREMFTRARMSAPCVIFFDEFDSLCPCRGEGNSQASDRVVNQMLTELDGVQARKHVQVLAATNRPDLIDRAILRSGRFQHHIYVPLPGNDDRHDILCRLTAKKPISSDVNLNQIALDTPRYSGADLAALTREALQLAVDDIVPQKLSDAVSMRGEDVLVTQTHLEAAMRRVPPSVTLEQCEEYELLRRKWEQSN